MSNPTYRKIVEQIWADGRIVPEELSTLVTLQKELGVPEEDAAEIEREVIGVTKEEALVSGMGTSAPHDPAAPMPPSPPESVAPLRKDGDDLRCPSCQCANGPEVLFCRGCGEGLEMSCPACEAKHRVGLRHCAMCGANVGEVREGKMRLTAASKALDEARLGVAQREAQDGLNLLEGARLGAAEGVPDGLRKILKAAQERDKQATTLLEEAQELERTEHYEEALKSLQQAAELYDTHGPRATGGEERYPALIGVRDGRLALAKAQEAEVQSSYHSALGHYRVAAELDPSHEDARQRAEAEMPVLMKLAQVDPVLEKGDLGQAAHMLEGLLASRPSQVTEADAPQIALVDLELKGREETLVSLRAEADGCVAAVEHALEKRQLQDAARLLEAAGNWSEYDERIGSLWARHKGLADELLGERAEHAATSDRARFRKVLVAVSITVALLLAALWVREWRGNGTHLAAAEEALAKGEFEDVEDQLGGVNRAGWVPHDSSLYGELQARVELHQDLNKRWPRGELPESLASLAKNRSKLVGEVYSSFNDQLVDRAWSEVGNGRDPEAYVDEMTGDAEPGAIQVRERYVLILGLMDRWSRAGGDPPDSVLETAGNRFKSKEEVVQSYNELLVKMAWNQVGNDPDPYLDAMEVDASATMKDVRDEIRKRQKLIDDWPVGYAPPDVVIAAKASAQVWEHVVGIFNDHLLKSAWSEVRNDRDPSAYVNAITGDAELMGREAQKRHELISDLRDRWPEGGLPERVVGDAKDRSNTAEDILGIFDDHLVKMAWNEVGTNRGPSDYVKAMNGGGKPEGVNAQTRHDLISSLRSRWPWSSELPEVVMSAAQKRRTSEEEIEQVLATAGSDHFERAFKNVEGGPWRELDDLASVDAALSDLQDMLEDLRVSQLDVERPDLKERVTDLNKEAARERERRMASEASDAREDREREKILNPLGWKVLDSTPGVRGLAKKVQEPVSGLVFVLIEPGRFKMGSPLNEKGRTPLDLDLRAVKLEKAFYLGEMEVTQGQWIQVTGSNPPAAYGNKQGEVDANHPLEPGRPVESLSWSRAKKFLATLTEMNPGRQPTFRLPMEEEWEFACRAGTQTPFSFGREISRASANFGGRLGYGQSTPVGTFQQNVWGLYDMHGNVAEWCEDKYEDGGAKGRFVVKGGDWSAPMNSCRSASRAAHDDWENEKTAHGRGGLGLRVAFTAPK